MLQIVNSVVMNHVVIEDGCHIQGSVVCNNVQLQERAVLKDCQVLSSVLPVAELASNIFHCVIAFLGLFNRKIIISGQKFVFWTVKVYSDLILIRSGAP